MIRTSLVDLIGNTPMLELKNFSQNLGISARIIAKLEYFNPLSSVKDRVAYAMITDAEQKGLIKKDTILIEPTSGNTGIGLAFAAAAKGLKLILTMPETMSLERRNLLKALGAELILTPGAKGMKGAIAHAEDLAAQNPNMLLLGQFTNPANPQIHKSTTAVEIWNDCSGNLDFFVAGVGTGGTITGVGQYLKEKNPSIKIIAVEPSDSPVLSEGRAGTHGIQGIGAGFVPKILDTTVIDEIIPTQTQSAYEMCRELSKTEGLLVGISSGAALSAAVALAKRPESSSKTIIVLFPDSGERYLSTTLFSE